MPLWFLNLVGAGTTGFLNLNTNGIWTGYFFATRAVPCVLECTGCCSGVLSSTLILTGHTTYVISLTHITTLWVDLSQGAGQKGRSPIRDTKTLLRNQIHQELLFKGLYPVQRQEKTQISYRVLLSWVEHWNCWGWGAVVQRRGSLPSSVHSLSFKKCWIHI